MNSPFSAVLLAGGQSRRMGRDKAFIEVEGVPLWRRQLRILEQLKPAEIFLAGPPRPEWNDAGCAIIPDAQENCGPLGGLVAALRLCSTDLLLALAVDLPNISMEFLDSLLRLCAHGKGALSVTNRFEPLVAVYPTTLLHPAEELLLSGRYSLQEFAARCVAENQMILHQVSPSEAGLFLNMNTPMDLAAITR